MGIQKDAIIYKDDIHEYLVSKGFETIRSASVDGTFFGVRTKTVSGYFWIRNNYLYNESTVWNAGVTYAIKLRVSYDSKVWESLQGANLNQIPGSAPLYWREISGGIALTTFNNINYSASFRGIANTADKVLFTFYKVTWDANQTEILTVVRSDLIPQVAASSISFQAVAGYYKYEMELSSQGAFARSTGTIKAKRSANDADRGDRIRVFSSDFKELLDPGATPVTVALAKSGRLSTDNFYGGEYAAP